MPTDPLDVVKSRLDAFNDRTIDKKAEAIFAPDYTTISPMTGEEIKGPQAQAAYDMKWLDVAPDIKATLLEHDVKGENVTMKVRFAGTFTGAMKTPQGEIAGTGKPFAMEPNVAAIVRDGKIVNWSSDADMADFLKQVGVEMPQG